jgi:hypothetical protein
MINAEKIEAIDKAVKDLGAATGGDMTALHRALCEDALLDEDACENYINHYTKNVMRILKNQQYGKDRLSVLGTALRHVLCVGINAGREDQPLV